MRRQTRSRRTFRQNHCFSPQPHSPADSGYDSFENSPKTPPPRRFIRIPVFDGSGSLDSAEISIKEAELDKPCPKTPKATRFTPIPSLVPALTPLSQNHGAPVEDEQGRPVRRSVNARVFSTAFHNSKPSTQDDLEKHEGRIATALDINRFGMDIGGSAKKSLPVRREGHSVNLEQKLTRRTEIPMPVRSRIIPTAPFRVLDAPNLRDDFYCSPLAYSVTSNTLVVCLGNLLYAWSEDRGVSMIHGAHSEAWLTSIAFSSTQGAKAILGIGQSDGSLILRSVYDALPRFEVQQPFPVACVSWRPVCTLRPSKNPFNPGVLVQTEDLVVGDEMGNMYYYVIEWPMAWEVSRDTWPGAVSLVAKITIHSQQICGLAWAPDGKLFASGGNDNLCCLFEVDRILEQSLIYPARDENAHLLRLEPFSFDVGVSMRGGTGLSRHSTMAPYLNPRANENSAEVETFRTSLDSLRHLGSGLERHRWVHGAAVKAIAFCPWRRGLVATGGGSNDKCIHFFHTASGTTLATISVSAQVTSLIWSTTRREIAATFGYAQPEHPYRIAIFSWPECKQVAAIPWEGELRALYAIPYPRGPVYSKNHKGGAAAQEGCIVVASSDKSIKFHEVWSRERGAKIDGTGMGMLGGSDILEGLEGIDKQGGVIR
ncbi:hypothetical protein AK830_g5367 [Neonectria ditissima]|uniref:Meiosis-specific APC/C activator protein AMA1 n=1 Tax=Neonectria ditissima TaxID=78410 RepID=A0A0P7BJ56_9HYPO|nr:hypothetical protein AK830_g5367 [Neonectria ditissima]